jgi:hypothetical protein
MSEVNSVVSSANARSAYGVGQYPEGISARCQNWLKGTKNQSKMLQNLSKMKI